MIGKVFPYIPFYFQSDTIQLEVHAVEIALSITFFPPVSRSTKVGSCPGTVSFSISCAKTDGTDMNSIVNK